MQYIACLGGGMQASGASNGHKSRRRRFAWRNILHRRCPDTVQSVTFRAENRPLSFQSVQGHRIEYAWTGAGRGRPALVLLHDGLGSVSMWRDFPSMLSEATGRAVLAYSRLGYGRSDPLRTPRATKFMHDEALVALPALLDALAVRTPILVGHSDGGSIALIHAAASGREVAGIVALAPHVKVEECSLRALRDARDAYAVP